MKFDFVSYIHKNTPPAMAGGKYVFHRPPDRLASGNQLVEHKWVASVNSVHHLHGLLYMYAVITHFAAIGGIPKLGRGRL